MLKFRFCFVLLKIQLLLLNGSNRLLTEKRQNIGYIELFVYYVHVKRVAMLSPYGRILPNTFLLASASRRLLMSRM